MKRQRSPSLHQATLGESYQRADAKRAAAKFLPLPDELLLDEVMSCLGDDLRSLAALASTCRRFYDSPWRTKHFSGHLTIAYVYAWSEEEMDERTSERERKTLRELWAKNPVWPKLSRNGQETFDTIAPYIQTLEYCLPCHHDWFVLSLEQCTQLRAVTFQGNECYSGSTWETALPASIEVMTFQGIGGYAIAQQHPALKTYRWSSPLGFPGERRVFRILC